MKLNRISLPLTEEGSGWGNIAQNYVRKAITGDWEPSGSCALLSIETSEKGACDAQTTEKEYSDKLAKTYPDKAKVQQLLKAMQQKILKKEEIPLPEKPTGVQYTADELKKTYVQQAAAKDTCRYCMFYIAPERSS